MPSSNPRSMWTGSITFGLVNIPVKMYTAVQEERIHFKMLHDEDKVPLKQKMYCPVENKDVHPEHIVRGYEVEKGQYVVVHEEDLEALEPKKTKAIEIEDFVDLDDIDPIFFENPYYLAPDPGAGKAYKLLVDAMTELRKVAVGRVVMRSKESLVAIRPLDGILCLETMRYADEINSIEGLMPEDVEEAEPTKRELDMAKQLVETLTTEFDPTKYHDEYREQLLGLIEAKQAGQEIVAEPMVEERGKVVDLMAALEASLSRAGRGGTPGESDEEELPPAAEAKSKPRKRGRKSA